MVRKFKFPNYYSSSFIKAIKEKHRSEDPHRRLYTPTSIDIDSLRFHLARYFGFCFGVENAIEIVYQTINNNPKKDIFLLGEIIHNPVVNEDLKRKGVTFLSLEKKETSANEDSHKKRNKIS